MFLKAQLYFPYNFVPILEAPALGMGEGKRVLKRSLLSTTVSSVGSWHGDYLFEVGVVLLQTRKWI